MCVDLECTHACTKPYLWKVSTDQGEHRMHMETSPREGANRKWKASGRHQGLCEDARETQERMVGGSPFRRVRTHEEGSG